MPSPDYQMGALETRQRVQETALLEVKTTMDKIWERLEQQAKTLHAIDRRTAETVQAMSRLDRIEKEHNARQCVFDAPVRSKLDQPIGVLLAEIAISALKIVGVGMVVSLIVLAVSRLNLG